MKYAIICAIALTVLCSCTSNPTVAPITDVGCALETSVTSGMAKGVATALSCSNTNAIQSSIQTALGNVNFCSASVQAQATKLKSMALVGNLLCPIAVNAVMGYLSNSIPSAWGCSAGSSASTLNTAITSACEAVTPI